MTAAPTLRVNSPTGIIAVASHLLGFVPEESLVVLFARGSLVSLTMRADLAQLHDRELLRSAARAAESAEADTAFLVAFSSEVSPAVRRAAMTFGLEIEAVSITTDYPVTVSAAYAVGSDAWFDLLDDPDLARDLAPIDSDPIRAEAVFRGLAPARSRTEIVNRFAPGSEPMPPGFGRAFASTMAELADLDDDAVAALARGLFADLAACEPSPQQKGRATAVALHSAAWWPACEAVPTTTADAARRWLDLWGSCVRCVSGSAAVVPLLLSGLAAWAGMGDGSTANICAEAAERIDPGHLGVHILATSQRDCVDPKEWPGILEALRVVDAAEADIFG